MNNVIQEHQLSDPGSDLVASPIRVLGIGGAGCRVLELLRSGDLGSASFVAMNTDAVALQDCGVNHRIQLGARLTRGLGAGGDPEIGRAAVEESSEAIRAACRGADLVFVIAGLGGGTGTGVAPLVARLAREAGALVLGLVTLPFACEGARRQRQARLGLEELKSVADVVLTLPNQRVLSLIDENTSLLETFRFTDALLCEGVYGVWRIIGRSGLLNVDLADLRELLRDRHAESYFACAEAEGDSRSREVVERLVLSPLLENGQLLRETASLLASVVSGPSLTMAEVNRVIELLRRECDGAELLLGATVDPALGDRLSLTLIGLRNGNTEQDDSVAPRSVSGRTAETTVDGVEPGLRLRSSGSRRSRMRSGSTASGQGGAEQAVPARSDRVARAALRQAMLPLEAVSKGRFEKSEPTVYRGADLDVPTFIRRGVVLN